MKRAWRAAAGGEQALSAECPPWQVSVNYRRCQSREVSTLSQNKDSLGVGAGFSCGKVFISGVGVWPLPRGSPAPLPSCLLFWLNVSGSSIGASWPWRGHPPLPQSCLSLSSALGVGYDPVSDPKDGSQPGGETWLRSGRGNAWLSRWKQRQGDSPEREVQVTVLTPPRAGAEARPQGLGWGLGRRREGTQG